MKSTARRPVDLQSITLSQAVHVAVEERSKRIEARRGRRPLAERLNEIALHCAALPRLSRESEDEILGYDERGVPR